MSNSKETDGIIDRSADQKGCTRRVFLATAVGLGAAPIAIYGTIDLGLAVKEYYGDYPQQQKVLQTELDSKYGTSTAQDGAKAAARLNEVEVEVQKAAAQNNMGRVKEITSSSEFQDAYQEKVRTGVLAKSRKDIESAESIAAVDKSNSRMLAGMMTAFGWGGISTFSLLSLRPGYIREKARMKSESVNSMYTIHPDWRFNTPQQDEVSSFFRSVSYLPPIGGKIPLVVTSQGKRAHEHLEPSWLAEEQVEKINALRFSGELGRAYVHQLTVQGRLPDEFKLTALALILNSPYPNDWDNPMITAYWGTVAPLVHDGGNVQAHRNPKWGRVKGRTDFLQRVVLVKEPTLEELENLTVEEKSHLPIDTLNRARAEQQERDRLLLEAKAYQRLALACHAYAGSAPRHIPKDIRAQLSAEWQGFQYQTIKLLEEYGIEGAANVKWFLDTPRQLGNWPGGRYEADWPPIQQELVDLEHVRGRQPEIRDRIISILENSTNNIDKTIGLIA